MKRTLICLTALLLAGAMAWAQDDEKPKFKINPTGRILMDAAGYIGGNGDGSEEAVGGGKFVSGVAIPDIRLGTKVSYGKWKGKIDIGFSYAKLSLKDVYLEYDPNKKNLIRVGYFVPQFGYNATTSSSMKITMEEMTSNEFFAVGGRLLGAMYQHNGDNYLGAAGIFAEAAAVTNNAKVMGKQAFSAITRQLWRPFHETGKMAQLGLSVQYVAPKYDANPENNHNSFTYSANFPSRVSKVTNLEAFIDKAKGNVILSPELMLCKGKWALESQYYYMHVWRKDGLKAYRAQGVFGEVRGILKGTSDYTYDAGSGGIATPAPKSLEMVVGYNYTNASDPAAGIMGGVTNDANLTFNYYINSWMIARLRYSYTSVRDRDVAGMEASRHVNTIQARLQIIF